MNTQMFFKKSFWIASVLAVLVIVLAACQPAGNIQQNYGKLPVNANPKPTKVTAASSEVVVDMVTDPKLGQILVDGKGMTLYLFTKDGPDQSTCAGNCAKAWPPFLATGSVKAGPGVDQSMLGTAKLADGSMIVTYNQKPLYYWAQDAKAGDTMGQGVQNVWYVVSPQGKAVGMTAVIPVTGANTQVMINVADNPTFGKILVDGNGMTLYIFTKDGPNTSNCAGGCLAAWPPFLATGTVKAGDGVNASLIGSAKMPDGSMIVTYNQMPLYYWKGDVKAGDATGQGVQNVWYVISPDGKSVTGSAMATPTALPGY